MSEPVIPSMEAADLEEPSPAVIAKRARVALAAEVAYVIGETAVKGKQAARAAELMAYLDAEYARECRELDSLIATEMLGKPVNVDGSVIRLAPVDEAKH